MTYPPLLYTDGFLHFAYVRCLSAIAKGCKNLRDLSLNDCHLLTDRSLELLARGCTKLTRFEVNGCQNIGTSGLEYIGRFCRYVFLFLFLRNLIFHPRVRLCTRVYVRASTCACLCVRTHAHACACACVVTYPGSKVSLAQCI